MSSRKNLIAHIAMMEKKLQHHQCEVIKHKQYFISLKQHNKSILLFAVFFGFVLGWKKSPTFKFFELIKDIISIGFLALLNEIKQQFMRALKNSIQLR